MTKCCFDGCEKRSYYNYINEKTAIYCGKHKQPEMVDVKNKRCCFDGCQTIPVYNFINNKTRIYCSEHKLPEMVDVKNKRCCFDGCQTMPIYNFINEKKAIYCGEHKLPEMVDVKNKRCCFDGCLKQPIYNFIGKKTGIYCGEHRQENMVDVKHIRCKSEWCETQPSNKQYEGYCLRCFIYTFPDKPVLRNYKTKETAVADFIKSKFSQYDLVFDKKIRDGCSRRRPDILLDLGEQIITIEIDENQHEGYDCSCQNKRLMEISQDLGHRNIVFIRFNPDDYLDANVKKITSCWGNDKNGICVVKKTKHAEWEMRLNSLETQINYWIENKTDKMIEVVQLFYDENAE